MKAILDASPIIAFLDEIREFDLLLLARRLAYELIVPSHVWSEVTRKPSSRALLERCVDEASLVRWPPLPDTRLRQFEDAHPSLGAGESETLLVALDFQSIGLDVACILDERPARRVAGSLGLAVKGTLGVLRALCEHGLISIEKEALVLRVLRGTQFRADERLLR